MKRTPELRTLSEDHHSLVQVWYTPADPAEVTTRDGRPRNPKPFLLVTCRALASTDKDLEGHHREYGEGEDDRHEVR